MPGRDAMNAVGSPLPQQDRERRRPGYGTHAITYAVLGGLILGAVLLRGATWMRHPTSKGDVPVVLEQYTRSRVPGLQYIVVDSGGVVFEYAGGWADIKHRKAMTPATTLMAYSMTKVVTAMVVLQLVDKGAVGLDDEIDRYLPDTPYRGRHITIRQLLAHTAGLPNPIPLRWAHLAEADRGFDEAEALARVLREHPKLAFDPGEKFAYSNIGYWLLGKIVERATGHAYEDNVAANVLVPLHLSPQEMAFVIPDPARHANGYLARCSLLNLVKGFVTDSGFWGEYEGRWLRVRSHHLDGLAFGGLVGTARSFARLLQDQLRSESVLFRPETRRLLETQQVTGGGEPVPMTLGWHIGETGGVGYLFKEGGGGGFHAEMRLYPTRGLASVVMVNSTTFSSTRFLNRMDGAFLKP
ncbi:MAG TPA: serine hydrolase domain-containing protein [Gemmatimonadales bacterium]|mgnify:CR=1 FL=1|nr:serine hydrolase domain-containing protein [Gemmatimonadales bacterium]